MSRISDDEQAALDELRRRQGAFYVKTFLVTLVALTVLLLFWQPLMRPWIQERKGLANLAEARFTNMIRAESADAEREAAVLRAQAIAIVGAAAKEYPEYRSQEFIGGFAAALESGTIDQTFYIPTRASVPLLPAMGQLNAAPAAPQTPAEEEN